MEKFSLLIGECFDLSLNKKVANQTIIITKHQLELIEMFASTKKDSDLNTLYKLNDVEFKIMPIFDFNNVDYQEFNINYNYHSGAIVIFKGEKYELPFKSSGDPQHHMHNSGYPNQHNSIWRLL